MPEQLLGCLESWVNTPHARMCRNGKKRSLLTIFMECVLIFWYRESKRGSESESEARARCVRASRHGASTRVGHHGIYSNEQDDQPE
jgi:hypothetical protein